MINFTSIKEIIDEATRESKTISQIVLAQTAIDMEKSEEEICSEMYNMLDVMEKSVSDGLNPKIKSSSGLTGGMSNSMKVAVENEKTISGNFMASVIKNALAVAELNAAMGQIVAAPTAGSCGIIPACLTSIMEFYDIPREKIMMGLINAAGIGMVIAKNASISGAGGGCQAECGSAAAMAASAIVEIMGGSQEACGHAAAHALKSLMGLICDPVAGLVEEPCVLRNASSASIAVASAEMALSGIDSIIPIDEVVIMMGEVGRTLPTCFRETAEGGIAVTPTGIAITERLHRETSNNKNSTL